MSDATIRRQDAGGPLAIFRDGQLIANVPDDDISTAYGLRDLLATDLGVPADWFEVLKTCRDHPGASAVDCLDCEPI